MAKSDSNQKIIKPGQKLFFRPKGSTPEEMARNLMEFLREHGIPVEDDSETIPKKPT